MKVKRPQTMKDYIELVDQAVFEVSDLRAAMEYEDDAMSGLYDFVSVLEKELTVLLKSLKEDSYSFSKEDLPFMSAVNTINDILLPFKHLLRQINNTHINGLDE